MWGIREICLFLDYSCYVSTSLSWTRNCVDSGIICLDLKTSSSGDVFKMGKEWDSMDNWKSCFIEGCYLLLRKGLTFKYRQ